MPKRFILCVAALLPLAACDSGPAVEAENATPAEVAAAVDAAGGSENFVSPGLWRSQITIEDVSMPGLPAEMAARMKEEMGSQMTSEDCLTAQDVEKPSADFFAGQDDDSCTYDRFAMGGGKMDMQMTCDRGGAPQTMTMTGTYSQDRYTMTASSQAAGPAGAMTMKLRMEARRIGACTASEEAAG
ncbi:MAG: hypothetical protein B7Z08_05240 [Sphingomonadales bacterium 32-68-7]|nr:MAG: hypothetical protein B7Z33_07350 [Sphingomonadales bacterium 12-68-11]OYX09473.1 MAG: hypothetical protein B7Z08_05240 [Sphingomonadales bacterium 32-68-7]